MSIEDAITTLLSGVSMLGPAWAHPLRQGKDAALAALDALTAEGS